MHKTRRAECPCSSVPPAGTPALPALLQSPELGAGSVQELPCAQALGHANLGLLLQVSPPQAEEVKPRVCLHRAAAWLPTPEPLPWLLQLQGLPRGLPGPGGHSHCSCNLGLSWGCWVGQFRNTSASGAICNGCTASSRGTFPKELFHCSNLVSLHLQLGLPSSTQRNAGTRTWWPLEGGKWKAQFRKEFNCCCECDMAEGLGVQLSRGLGDSRLGEPLRHPSNEPRRKQWKCQRAGKDFSSGNITWPPGAKGVPLLPLNRTGNRARKAEEHNCVLSEYSCHKTGENKESPDCL